MTVYLDLVIILNFAVNFMLLMGASRLCGHRIALRRCLFGAVMGSIYAGICVLCRFRYIGGPLIQIAVLGIMGVAAYGWSYNAVQQTVLFVFLSMALAGIVAGWSIKNFLAIILSGVGVVVLCLVVFRGKNVGEKLVSVELCYGHRIHRMTALVDTGNLLTDPVTGQSVLIVGPQIAKDLFGLTTQQLEDPVCTMTQCAVVGLRLIPYRCVGKGSGMLLAANFDSVLVNGKQTGRLVAFSPYGFGSNVAYQALTGGNV